MAVQDIIAEFPLGARNSRQFRHAFDQSATIQRLVPGRDDLAQGCCYNLCYWFATLRLTMDPKDFAAFADNAMLEMAIRNQGHERFEVSARALRIMGYHAAITEREFATRYCFFRVNANLRSSLEIIDAILAARAVSMLLLQPSGRGPGHAVAFDTRSSIIFFDPNYGWFEDRSSPVGAAYFRDWFHRFYHASFYKRLFEHGRRKLVVWHPGEG